MFFVYDDHKIKPRKAFSGLSSDIDPTEMYMVHYKNSMYLDFFYKNGNATEKMRAGRELEIAQTKMKWWSHRTGFDHDRMLKLCEEVKRDWK